GDPDLQAFVLIGDAESVLDRLPPIRARQRILLSAGQIDHGRAEDRPESGDLHPTAEPKLLAIAQVLERAGNVAVKAQVSDFCIGPAAADGCIDLVAADGETALVEPESVGDAKPAAVADRGSADDVGKALREAGAHREDAGLAIEAIALADGGLDREAGQVETPVEAIGDTGAILPSVVARKAIEREQVRIFQIDRAGILVGNR